MDKQIKSDVFHDGDKVKITDGYFDGLTGLYAMPSSQAAGWHWVALDKPFNGYSYVCVSSFEHAK